MSWNKMRKKNYKQRERERCVSLNFLFNKTPKSVSFSSVCTYNLLSVCISLYTQQTHKKLKRVEFAELTQWVKKTMWIRFKFRSAVSFDVLDIGDRPAISVGELKSKIIAHKNLKSCNDFDLFFSDHVSGQGIHSFWCNSCVIWFDFDVFFVNLFMIA